MSPPILSIFAIVAVTGVAVAFTAWQAPEPEPPATSIREDPCPTRPADSVPETCEAAGLSAGRLPQAP